MKKEIQKIDNNLKDQISTLPAFSADSLQKMQEGLYSGNPLIGKGGIRSDLLKSLLELSLQGEMDSYLEDNRLEDGSNRRNGLSSKRIKSSVGDFDLNTPSKDNGRAEHSIKNIVLHHNFIGDDGAMMFADALKSGQLPNTKSIDVSGNNISDKGEGFFVNALDYVKQNLKIVFVNAKVYSKESLQSYIKTLLKIAKDNGIKTKEILTNEETIEHCKKGTLSVAKNITWGFAKCFTQADTPIALYEMDFHSLLVKSTTSYINHLKKPAQFACITQETIFSIADEEFANCLTGLDSGLNE